MFPVVFVALLLILGASNGAKAAENVIDRCWNQNDWRRDRQRLATCSVGFSGKMYNNIGKGTKPYIVTDPSDDPLNPRPGTLRYGATMIKGKVWISFQRDMAIKLEKTLVIGSYMTIDGRGATVHIAGGGCLSVLNAHDVIIHGLHIYNCQAQPASQVMGPGRKVVSLGPVDADAIRLVTSSKVWIDHNTLSNCQDGLLDVTRGSTGITISNNRFVNQDKVMLLGHDDGYVRDKNMKVTLVYNHFGPNCNQRMPRVRHGYAHVANNLYEGWTQYAIGGSSAPSIKSESNLFVASNNKEVMVDFNIVKNIVTWRDGVHQGSWNVYSVNDVFENGASFVPTGKLGTAKPNYAPDQWFPVASPNLVRALTRTSGAQKI